MLVEQDRVSSLSCPGSTDMPMHRRTYSGSHSPRRALRCTESRSNDCFVLGSVESDPWLLSQMLANMNSHSTRSSKDCSDVIERTAFQRHRRTDCSISSECGSSDVTVGAATIR